MPRVRFSQRSAEQVNALSHVTVVDDYRDIASTIEAIDDVAAWVAQKPQEQATEQHYHHQQRLTVRSPVIAHSRAVIRSPIETSPGSHSSRSSPSSHSSRSRERGGRSRVRGSKVSSKPSGVDSIVEGMTYGEVRISLNQMWRTRWVVKPEYMLQSGVTVGEFSMKYVLALLARRKRKAARPKRH